MAVEKYLIALTIVGIVDSISYMLVTPSLVFYVIQNGGDQQQYGLIMSAFSFSSFCTKPFIGWWSDKQGFRSPYLVSIAIALIGGVVYLMASALPSGSVAVGAILLARLLSGCGAANSALGFAYVARSVPRSKLTSTTSLLSMCRILGMALGPGLNVLVAYVDVPITKNWKLDSLNSVGIILITANLISLLAIYGLLDEPKEEESNDEEDLSKKEDCDAVDEDCTSSSPSTSDILFSFLSMDILVPMLSIFTFNANFQLIETGFAPAANDALGWGPVQSSIALGSLSFLVAINMFSVMKLSKAGVSDSNLLCGGLVASIFAYTSLYFLWTKNSSAWHFYVPIFLGSSSFPYMMVTTRSIFTVSVDSKPALKQYHGFMQAVLSMAASVAGFTTPGIVAAYILRSPDEVEASSDMRELTSVALSAPALSIVVLLGMVYLRVTGAVSDTKSDVKASKTVATEESLDRESLTETSSLLSPSKHPRYKRRSSNVELMLEGKFDGILEETMRME